MNIQLAQKVISALLNCGVREFEVCAGARNAPFVVILEMLKKKFPEVKVHSFFNENSAAFFALGRIKSQSAPVAVVTTSGTAVAELLPAVIEAYYEGLPLIAVSADRPSSYRGTGAPQTIQQVGIFSHYITNEFDISLDSEVDLSSWGGSSPLHLNVQFDEPLLDENNLQDWDIPINFNDKSVGTKKAIFNDSREPNSFNELNKLNNFNEPNNFDESNTSNEELLTWQKFCNTVKKPLVLIGPLKPSFRQEVEDFVLALNCPVIAEALSGLQDSEKLSSLILKSGEKLIRSLPQNYFDGVIRIGGISTSRLWRDLEVKYKNWSVLSFASPYWPGLARENDCISVCPQSFRYFAKLIPGYNFLKNELKNLDEIIHKNIFVLFKEYPQSEQAWIHHISSLIPENSRLYLGNSLPIREWDLFSNLNEKHLSIDGNRGANGIDGQLSTFMGWSEKGTDNWAIIGDLTALYDLSSLWCSQYLSGTKQKIVIMNNYGGMIFSQIFNRPEFLNKHRIHFQQWGEMWSWPSVLCESYVDIEREHLSSEKLVMEIRPDALQTTEFGKAYEELFQKYIKDFL